MPGDLRELWLAYPERNVRRLILEVHRAREIHDMTCADTTKALYLQQEKKYGHVNAYLLAILERLKLESVRLGSHGGIPVDVGRPKGFTHGLPATGMALNRSANVPFNGMDAFDPRDDDDTGD